MRTQVLFRTLITTIAAVVIGSFGLVGSVYAAPGGGGGGGGGPGGGGGGGGGGDAGEPPDYGDLVILYRDEYGVPYLTGDSCQQPLASDDCDVDACTLVAGVPEFDSDGNEVFVIPVSPDTCGIVDPACGACTQEIEFGRANSARSPASVFEAQLEDVVVKLATADQIGLDAAGRLVACVDGGVDEEGQPLADTSSAVDSPLQNLAMYKQLMTYGYLGDGQIVLPATALETAARGIGVAVDKGGKVSVDMVVYLNQIMGLSDLPSTILGEPICIDVKEEVMGNIDMVTKCFLNYGNIPGSGVFGYGRGGNFGSLPFPAYIDDGYGNMEGVFEVLKWTELDPDYPTFDIYRGSIFERVFGGQEGKGTANIGGFVQEADDTREVINYMHSWPLPVAAVDGDGELVTFQTPVTCEGIEGDVDYDLSISADSGLQVPVQMVPTEEGREFIVTISNAGPDAASGSVWVKAETNGDTAVWKLLVDENGDLVYDEGTGLPIREEAAPFELAFEDLAAGSSKGWTTNFTVYPPVATKINWTATIVAEHDVNSTNNEVTETTNVRLTGKGGGKGGGGGGE